MVLHDYTIQKQKHSTPLLVNSCNSHMVQVIVRYINKSKMTFILFYLTFFLKTIKYMYAVKVINHHNLCSSWEYFFFPSPLCCNCTLVDMRNVVWLIKMFVIIFGCRFTYMIIRNCIVQVCIVQVWIFCMINI